VTGPPAGARHEMPVAWPHGKRFAFTVFDDTDKMTVHNGTEVYRLLHDLGLRTTKSVWPLAGPETPRIGGSTCEEPDYLAWVLDLQQQGFEIALHNATYHSSPREQALAGLARFRELFGSYPRIHVNHADCRDAIYWGPARVSGVHRRIYEAIMRGKTAGRDGGTNSESEHFWGDACQAHVTYVRNFVFRDINTLKRCPSMPYYDPDRPYVNRWFASSEGAKLESFCETIAASNQDRLEEEGGACIMYTHFGFPGFICDGRLDPTFVRLMTRLAEKGGWFVPVSELLDFLAEGRADLSISRRERARLERRWLFEKMFITRGTS